MILVYIIVSGLFLGLLFAIYSVYRLNLYIENLEEKVQEHITLTENLRQSIKDIVAEDTLENDGRLKKYRIQKERNFIYNGIKADEGNYEL
jgi:ABC-type phosphate transport system auxiliary subunit